MKPAVWAADGALLWPSGSVRTLKVNEGRNGISKSIIVITQLVSLPQPDIESAHRAQIEHLRVTADTQSAMETGQPKRPRKH